MNIFHHETVKNGRFKITFGQEPKVSVATSVIRMNMLANIQSEEDFDLLSEYTEEDVSALSDKGH